MIGRRAEAHAETQCIIETLSKVLVSDLDKSYNKNASRLSSLLLKHEHRGVSEFCFRNNTLFKEMHRVRCLVCNICNLETF